MTELAQIISSVGFPIAMCLLLLKVMRENNSTNAKIIDDLRTTINKNTIILTKIYEKLGSDEK